ncbi:protein of unknown function [Streptococcus thermophilus]|nr:protein of unknown function [Streptococcus thermophilus]
MKYNIDLEQYAKEAYDKYMNDNGFQSLIMRLNSFKLHR